MAYYGSGYQYGSTQSIYGQSTIIIAVSSSVTADSTVYTTGETVKITASVQLNAVVYYDSRYSLGWMSNPTGLVSYLNNAGFVTKNADDLQTWMKARIAAGDANQSVCVNSMGVEPDTIIETEDTNCTLRQYLNAGGRFLHVGDVQLYYQGHNDGTTTAWGAGGSSDIIGVGTTDWGDSSYATITSDGSAWGMSISDQGSRPVPTSDVTTVFSEIPSANAACSWLKNFNSTYPNSGFIRYHSQSYDGNDATTNQDLLNLSLHVMPTLAVSLANATASVSSNASGVVYTQSSTTAIASVANTVSASVSATSTASDTGEFTTSVSENDDQWIMPYAFYNGSLYKYVAISSVAPTVTGGSGVTITNDGAPNGTTGNAANIDSYLITSNAPINTITVGTTTQNSFNLRYGDIFWYGVWWNSGSPQTIPAGYDGAFAIGRTEDLGTSQWEALLDSVATSFSQNVSIHYFEAPIDRSKSHSVQITYVGGGMGIQFAFWGYAQAIGAQVAASVTSSVSSTSTVTGNVTGAFLAAGSLSSGTTLSGFATATFSVSGSSTSTSTLSAIPTASVAGAAGITAGSIVTANVDVTQAVSGAASATSSISAISQGIFAISSSISTGSSGSATASAIDTVQGSIVTSSSASAQPSSTFNSSASIIAGSSTSAIVAAIMQVSGTINTRPIYGGGKTYSNLAYSSAYVSANTQRIVWASGTATADATLQANESIIGAISGEVSANSGVMGNATGLFGVSASVSATSSTGATVTQAAATSGAVNATSAIAGTASGTFQAAGRVNASSVTSATVSVAMLAVGIISATSSASAEFTGTVHTSGSIIAVSSLTALASISEIRGIFAPDLNALGQSDPSLGVMATFKDNLSIAGQMYEAILVAGVNAAISLSGVADASGIFVTAQFAIPKQLSGVLQTTQSMPGIFASSVPVSGHVITNDEEGDFIYSLPIAAGF